MAPVQSDDQTDNHSLNRWQQVPEDQEDWQMRTDIDTIEARLVVRDLEANRTNYTAHSDALFWATDTGAIYTGDGASWSKESIEAAAITEAGDDVVSSSTGDYDIQKDGTDGAGVINFKTT